MPNTATTYSTDKLEFSGVSSSNRKFSLTSFNEMYSTIKNLPFVIAIKNKRSPKKGNQKQMQYLQKH